MISAQATINAPPSVAPFMAFLLDSAEDQARLGQYYDPTDFVREALVVAARAGIALDAEDLARRLAGDPAGIARFMPPPVELACWPGAHWLPLCSSPTAGAPAFDWGWVGTNDFGQPFFADSVRTLSGLPLNRLLRTRTSLATVMAGNTGEVSLPMAGFVHHMSRCGSTLVASLLRQIEGNLVLSEPEPLDAVLRWAAHGAPDTATGTQAIRAVVAALGGARDASWKRIIIKADCWHTLLMPVLLEAFPDTPWIFLTRDPVEVLQSQSMIPGVQVVPGILPAWLTGVDAAETGLEEFPARMIGAMCEAAARTLPRGGVAVRYEELESALTGTIAPYFGLSLTAESAAAIERTFTVDAKAPQTVFVADGAAKRRAAPPCLREFAERFVAPALAKLHRGHGSNN